MVDNNGVMEYSKVLVTTSATTLALDGYCAVLSNGASRPNLRTGQNTSTVLLIS